MKHWNPSLCFFMLFLSFFLIIVPTAVSADEKTADKVYKIEISDSPTRGHANAPATIVVFSDFQCPSCRVTEDTLHEAMSDFTDEVRIVFKYFPLTSHDGAVPAAMAGVAAHRQGMFWQIHDLLFDRANEISVENILKWSEEAGLDIDRFKKDFIAEETLKKIKRDKIEGQLIGVNATPTLFINGRKVDGDLKTALKRAVDEGRNLQKKGVTNIYEEITKNGFTPLKHPSPQIPKTVYHVPVPEHAPVWGERDAPVTIVLFDDFQCGYCRKLYHTMERVRNQFAGDLRIVFINLPMPFHYLAEPASRAALAALNQGRFWEMHDYLFSNYDPLKKPDFHPLLEEVVSTKGIDIHEIEKKIGTGETNAVLGYLAAAGKEYGVDAKTLNSKAAELSSRNFHTHLARASKSMGMNYDRLIKEMNADGISLMLESDRILASRLGVAGTPVAFVNGRLIDGAQPYETFDKVIGKELVKAAELIRKGTRKEEIYGKLIENGHRTIASKSRARRAGQDSRRVYKINITGNEPVYGEKDAPVTIVEFSDIQCVFCSDNIATLKNIVGQYKGDVRVVMKHFPLKSHDQARGAAEYLASIKYEYGDDVFWKMHDLLFVNQKSLNEDNYRRWAKENNLNWNRISELRSGPIVKEIVKKDIECAVKLGLRDVPAFFINGRKVLGAQSEKTFRIIIDDILAKNKTS